MDKGRIDNGDAAINASLARLRLDYIDLMLLHHSQPENDVAAYKAMEQAVADGRLKNIGLSNYYAPDDFDRVINTAQFCLLFCRMKRTLTIKAQI